MTSPSPQIDRLLEDVSDWVEAGDYREARRLMHGVEALHPDTEQMAKIALLRDTTGPDVFAWALSGTIAVSLILVAVFMYS